MALANLAPAGDGVEDADSHCFQTVGHAAVGALAAATGLPLVRRRLCGTSARTASTWACLGWVGRGFWGSGDASTPSSWLHVLNSRSNHP